MPSSAVAVLSTLAALAAPEVAASQAPEADRNARVLARLEEELARRYAYKGGEEWLIRSLERNRALGKYTDEDAAGLGAVLTADLRGWTSDKHFMVAHMPAFAAELEAHAEQQHEDQAAPEDDPQEAAVDFGVRRVEMLDDRVGLIRLDRIAFSPSTIGVFQEALASLPQANALILDLRDNHGGSADTVPGLASCFFPAGERVTLATKYWRPDDEHTAIETDPTLEGVRYLEHPVLVLTSEDTRSAAEALAYHLRAFGLAYVVGEPSSGGAHPADMISLGDGFVALIPMGLVTSARTGTDWEGRGVPVDVPCTAAEAEEVALDLALRLLDGER